MVPRLHDRCNIRRGAISSRLQIWKYSFLNGRCLPLRRGQLLSNADIYTYSIYISRDISYTYIRELTLCALFQQSILLCCKVVQCLL